MVNKIAIRTDTAANWTTADPTLEAGEQGHETDTGRRKIGDGTTAWTSLDYINPSTGVNDVSADYTITGRDDDPIINVTTGGTDRTITLPAGSAMIAGDTIEVHKVDSGTGKVTVSRAGSDTIDGVTSIDIDSQYDYAKLRWSGSYWALVEYKDHGSNSNGEWYREANGRMVCTDRRDNTASSYQTWTFPAAFASATDIVFTGASVEGVAIFAVVQSAPSTTAISWAMIFDNSLYTGTKEIGIKATGRWRA